MPNLHDWNLVGSNGQTIYGTTHLPADPQAAPGVLLIAHGFKGYKDYGFLPVIAQRAADAGLIAHRFNFAHSGMTDRPDTFARPDLFEQDTWSRQVQDLQTVHLAARSRLVPDQGPERDIKPVVWFGHSRGGDACLLAGARAFAPDFYMNRYRGRYEAKPVGIIAAAAPDYAQKFSEDQKRMLRRAGYLVSESSRTGQALKVGRAWLDEIESDPEAFDPVTAASHIACPLLIVHGDADETVPVSAAHALDQAAPDSELIILPGGTHTFNATNPLPKDEPLPDQAARLIDATVNFALARLTITPSSRRR